MADKPKYTKKQTAAHYKGVAAAAQDWKAMGGKKGGGGGGNKNNNGCALVLIAMLGTILLVTYGIGRVFV